MDLKKLLFSVLLLSSVCSRAQDVKNHFNFYGFVRNDFYYNSRQNVEAIDGIFHIFPMPKELDANGKDVNAKPQAEMLSIASRFGVDVSGIDILGAKSMAKLEADFAGVGTTYFLLRLRQAYVKLDWENTEFLLGQTWHPLFGSVMPTMMSLNTGAPFNPFNRSPQLRVKQRLGTSITLLGAAIYQMQFSSPGPSGLSSKYQKEAVLPNFYLGLESKTEHITAGAGADFKKLKPADNSCLSSFSTVAYIEYVTSKFQIKVKGILGKNLSDHMMASGYGLSNLDEGKAEFTNFGITTAWLNIIYGSKWRIGVFGGWSQNLGTQKDLAADMDGNFTFYGRGYFMDKQIIIDRLLRISPHVSYNISKFTFGLEYDLTMAWYGNINQRGKADDTYMVNNHRAVMTMVYNF